MLGPDLTRPFGATGLTVSALGFGAMHLDSSRLDDPAAQALVREVLDVGITFVDTARLYRDSEERLGRFLRGRRDSVVLSTKVGYDVPGEVDWTAGAVRGGVERALRVLDTDVLDVVFLHGCDLATLERGDVVAALLACRDAGTVRVAGYSGEGAELQWAVASGAFGAVQTSVNLADQASLREVLPVAVERGIGVVAKRPLAGGMWRHESRPTGVYGETYWDRLRTTGLQPEVDDWPGTALRFAAFTPGVSTAIVGSSDPAHVREAVEAVSRGPLPDAERARWLDAFAPHAEEWPGEA